MAWYRAGTVTVTNGSPTVTGSGTTWTASINPGDIFTTDGIRLYEIKSVDSDTQLTLTENYVGTTASAIAYAIVLIYTSNAAIASRMSSLIQSYQTNTDEMIAWLSGTAGGGPNNNGTYPVSDFYGNVTYIKSAPEFQAEMDAATASITQSQTDASTAVTNANAAVTSANAATTSANNAADAANTATSNANAATTAANNAASSATTAASSATTAADAANTATSNANTATTAANNAATAANNAASSATSAADAANTATTNANTATTAANNAASSATSAASDASTATTNANNATSAANTAAGNANTAATNANNAATAANDAATAANNAAQAKLATSSTPGIVQPGTGLSVDSNGLLSVTDSGYTLPVATTSTLGGVKQGANVTIAADGTLSASGDVTSVAGKTGAVTLTASDVSGLSTVATSGSYTDLSNQPTIPTNNNQLTNGAGFITSAGAPVQSVAGKTGAVTLANTDISGLGTAATLNVGTAANNIPQLDANAKMPAVDGSALTNVNAAKLGGNIIGTAANNIVQLDANAKLPAVDGSQLKNIPAGTQPYMLVVEKQALMTAASTSLLGSFQRVLNTVLQNSISGSSLSNNAITLPAGTYYITASAPAYECNSHQLALKNMTAGTFLAYGTSNYASYQYQTASLSEVSVEFTLSAPAAIALFHFIQANSGPAYGMYTDSSLTGAYEVYGRVEIFKVA